LDRHTWISLSDNYFYSLSEFQIHKILVMTLNQLRKIRVPDSALDLLLAPEQAQDPELAPEGPRSTDHLRKIKAPDTELLAPSGIGSDSQIEPLFG
jgi:hypothetical protein